MKAEWTAKELLSLNLPDLPGTERGIVLSLKNYGCDPLYKSMRGGYAYVFQFKLLPEKIRSVMSLSSCVTPCAESSVTGAHLGHRYAEELKGAAALKQRCVEASLAAFQALPEARRKEAEARIEILLARDAFLRAAALPLKVGSIAFSREYAAGRIKLPGWVTEIASRNGGLSVSWSTLNRWKKAFDADGLSGLAGRYASRAGETSIPQHMQKFIEAMKVEHPRARVQLIVKGLEARFAGQEIPNASAVRRFVKRWEKENESIFLFVTDPDTWKNKKQLATGDASENITALNQLWEMDSTPGDVMLTDGRHTVIACIDVYSRRMKLLVSPTSKAEAVAALLRRCLLDWGVPAIVKTDNGQDYVSNHMVRVLDSLEVDQKLCTRFSPEQKPHVERSIGTFAHDIVELLPGFIGHNVADRKAIEARKSFAQRLMTKGQTVEVKMSSDEFQKICDRWVNAMYHQDPHRGINGKSPAMLAREWKEPIRRIENERALDMLLCAAPGGGGYRVITKKGVEVDGLSYSGVGMAGHEGKRVFVLKDPADLGVIYLYLENEQSGKREFLCDAIEPCMKGIDRAEHAARLRAVQKQVMNEGRKELKKAAKEAAVQTIYEEILTHREAQIANLAEFPKRCEPYTTPALDEAARAVAHIERKLAGPVPIEITAEQEAVANQVISLADVRRGRPLPANDWERYEQDLDDIRAGEELPESELAWMKKFELRLEGKSRMTVDGER